ncbi:unnamed protein product [Sphenostylis stenocarpa]|uniref:Uncharacterized protein n=1 Tax=Sphenostylis stenocarpa TaxID=92480 RepID=A0AA87B6R7_9FABA|nr:unnamed protein product [Sphenostylis stenocarpa]
MQSDIPTSSDLNLPWKDQNRVKDTSLTNSTLTKSPVACRVSNQKAPAAKSITLHTFNQQRQQQFVVSRSIPGDKFEQIEEKLFHLDTFCIQDVKCSFNSKYLSGSMEGKGWKEERRRVRKVLVHKFLLDTATRGSGTQQLPRKLKDKNYAATE